MPCNAPIVLGSRPHDQTTRKYLLRQYFGTDKHTVKMVTWLKKNNVEDKEAIFNYCIILAINTNSWLRQAALPLFYREKHTE